MVVLLTLSRDYAQPPMHPLNQTHRETTVPPSAHLAQNKKLFPVWTAGWFYHLDLCRRFLLTKKHLVLC